MAYSRRKSVLPNIWIVLTCLLIALGIIFYINGDRWLGGLGSLDGTEITEDVRNTARALRDGEILQETPVTDDVLAEYIVAPGDPRYLLIPRIKEKARVVPLGIANNTIEVPANINDVGWLRDNPGPIGEGELTVIDGHVLGRENPGVFSELKELTSGDEVIIENGSGELIVYLVRSSKIVSKNEAAETTLLQPIDAGQDVLRLITCYGDFIKDSNTYTERLIVEAIKK